MFLKILLLNFMLLFLLWFFITQQIRFILPALILLSIIMCALIFKEDYLSSDYKKIIWLIIIFTTTTNFLFFFATHIKRTTFWAGNLDKGTYIDNYFENYKIFNFALPFLKKNEMIYLVNDNRIFYCRGHCIPSTSFNIIKWNKNISPQKRYKNLLSFNVCCVLFNTNLIYYSKPAANLIISDLQNNYLLPFCKKCKYPFKNNVFLYKINKKKIYYNYVK